MVRAVPSPVAARPSLLSALAHRLEKRPVLVEDAACLGRIGIERPVSALVAASQHHAFSPREHIQIRYRGFDRIAHIGLGLHERQLALDGHERVVREDRPGGRGFNRGSARATQCSIRAVRASFVAVRLMPIFARQQDYPARIAAAD